MSRTADVVIVGAGFAGAATAWHLARRGVRSVVILEAEALPGLHASGRNASLVYHLVSDPDQAAMSAAGARFYASPPEGFSPRPLFRRTGSILGVSDPGLAGLEASLRMALDRGLGARYVDPTDLLARIPLLEGAPIASAIEVPEDGVVDIRALLSGYLDGAKAVGAELRTGSRVTAVRTSGGRISAVVSVTGTIETGCLVNAAGGWAGTVGVLAGVGERTLQPLLRHIYLSTPDPVVDPAWPFVWHDDVDVYFRPEGGGLLLSPCDESAQPAGDAQPDPAGEALLRDKLARAFPALASVGLPVVRACLRTYAADRRFLLGRDPDLEGLIWVAGLGGHGMSTSWSVGEAGARAVTGEPSPVLDAFRVDRLAAGRPGSPPG